MFVPKWLVGVNVPVKAVINTYLSAPDLSIQYEIPVKEYKVCELQSPSESA
jgi:hypothetical protein